MVIEIKTIMSIYWSCEPSVSNRFPTKMLLLTLALWNVTAKFPNTARFLKILEASEKPSYINVITFENHSNSYEFLRQFEQPKVIIDYTLLTLKGDTLTGFNYLNLPQNDLTPTLKFYYNRSFMTVILIEKIWKLSVEFVEWFLPFSKLSTVLIISKGENKQYLEKMLEAFHSEKFLNVLHVDIASFEENEVITTYENFPKYKPVLSREFQKEDVRNICLKDISIGFLHLQYFYQRKK